MMDQSQVEPQRHHTELLSPDPDKVASRIYRPWASWRVQWDSREMMEGRVIEEIRLFMLHETLIGVMKQFCRDPLKS